jgi:hypothetical protein
VLIMTSEPLLAEAGPSDGGGDTRVTGGREEGRGVSNPG